MHLQPFALERYFAQHEFTVGHNLAGSDIEGMRMVDLLALADGETAAMWQELTLGYTESAGHPLLRREIAAMDGLDPADVLVCAGAEEAIFIAVHALLGAGDHAVAVTPAYQSLHEVARSAGASVTLVELRYDEQWRLDIAELQSALRPETRVVAINFPHNPTGSHVSQATLLALTAICEARGITLLSDEVYRFLEHDRRDRLPAAAALGERAVSVGVMSKSFALAGLRIGWLASRDHTLLSRAARIKDYTTICNAAPSETLALVALRARETVLERSRDIVAHNLGIARRLMARYAEHLEWVEPRAGSVAFPRFRSPKVDVDAWVAGLIARESTLILPGSVFGMESHFRLGLGRRNAPVGLEHLDSYLRHSLCDPGET